MENLRDLGEQASAIAWDVAMGNWEKAVQEAKDLAKHFGSGSSDCKYCLLGSKPFNSLFKRRENGNNSYDVSIFCSGRDEAEGI